MSRIPWRAYFALSLSMALAGSAVIVGKVITDSFPVFLAAALRFAIASGIMLPMLLKAGRGIPLPVRMDMGILFLEAFAGNFLYTIFLLYGLRLTSATESGIILGTAPAAVGLISFLFLRESLTWNKGIGMLIATAGIVVINTIGTTSAGGQSANSLLGNILIFGAVLGEALWAILGKTVSGRIAPLTIAGLTSFFALILFSPFAIYQAWGFKFAAPPLIGWLSIGYYGLATVAAYILWHQGIQKVQASTAGIFSGVAPITTVILSSLLLKESLPWSYAVGGVCVLLAIVLMTRNASDAKAEKVVIQAEERGV